MKTTSAKDQPVLGTVFGPAVVIGPPKPAKPEPPPEDRLEDYQVLKKRVLARWQEFIDKRLERVYSFETPAYRKTHSLAMFYNNYGSLVTWESAWVKFIHFDPKDPDLAEVGVVFTASYINPFQEQRVRSERFRRETWRRVDGEWYYVRK